MEVMHQRVIINITNKAKKHTHTKHKNQGPCETMYGIVSVSDFRCAVEMVYTYAASSKVIVTVLHNTTIPVICFHLQFQKNSFPVQNAITKYNQLITDLEKQATD